MLNQDGPPINRIIGTALRGIASKGLTLYTLNSCETPQDIERLWTSLELLNEKEILDSSLVFSELEDPLDLTDITEARVRHQTANATFQDVRLAAAAIHHRLSYGDFPLKADEFSDLLKGGLPQDPFADVPMKFKANSNDYTVYSVGPDRKDDGALFAYDPTNGYVSQGDIALTVPRERKYPFPRSHVRAENRERLLRIFPQGLPIDPFGPKRPEPASLLISDTTPVYVYSRGPDTDIDTGDDMGRFTPSNLYDPTNGTISSGDLFLKIPPTQD